MREDLSSDDVETLKWTVQFLSKSEKAFFLSEVQRLVDDSFGSSLSEFLEDDDELMKLASRDDDVWFICRTDLVRRLVYVNLRLARSKIAQLTAPEWKRLLRSIRLEENCGASHTAILEFGASTSLALESTLGCRVVFPIAAVVSGILNQTIGANELQRIVFSVATSRGKGEPIGVAVNSFIESSWAERVVDIVKRREGLLGEPKQTLAEVGLHYNLSRERIRQFESRFWRSIHPKGSRQEKQYIPLARQRARELTRILLEDFVSQGCSMVWKISDQGFAHRMFLAKCLGIEARRFDGSDVVVIGPAVKSLGTIQTKSFSSGLDTNAQDALRYIDPLFLAQEIASEKSCGLIDRDVTAIAESIAAWRIDRLNKIQKVYITLCNIGRPAHYSEITELYNAMFPGDMSSQRNIHAVLNRNDLGIVWVGRRGTFALSQWGNTRPQKSLHDTVTEIVITEYWKTRSPVPVSMIQKKLEDVRGPINPNSLVFATEANETLRYVLGDAFVPSELTACRNYSQYLPSRIATVDNELELVVDLLYVSSLAGFEFSGKHQESLVKLGNSNSIAELKELIQRGRGSPELARLFNSKLKIMQAERAISRFQAVTSSWINGRKRDSRVTWVLKTESAERGMSQQELLEMIESPYRTLIGGLPLASIEALQEKCTAIETQKKNSEQERGQTQESMALGIHVKEIRKLLNAVDWRQHFKDLDIWLPFLSLELIQKLKSTKSRTYGHLHRALIRANRQVGLSDDCMPWTRKFPSELASLPLLWLYQFDPNDRFLRILTTLSSAQCTNVGHLVAFHPVAWQTIRRFEPQFWTRLAIKLDI